MRLSFVILIVSIGQIGCSSSYIVSTSLNGDGMSLSEFNAAAKNEEAKIIFHDSSTLNVQDVWAEPDSASWINSTTSVKDVVAIGNIHKIILTSRSRGALDGTVIGILSGGTLGLLVKVLLAPDWSKDDDIIPSILVFPILGGISGLLTGPITGAVIEHTYEYEFINDSDKRFKKLFVDTFSLYKSHFNLSPQEGYGIVLGVNKTNKSEIFELGITDVSRLNDSEGSYLEKYFSLEINDRGPIFGFVGGVDVKWVADFGIAMSYMTSFAGLQGLFIRPHLGFSLIPGGNLHAVIQYDIPLWRTGYRNITQVMFGLRYNVGFLQRRNTE